MTRRVHLLLSLALAFTPLLLAAQTVLSSAATPGTADQLAAQMRLLAISPNDLTTLLTAGELSVKLDDLGAAASFFARAEKVDPHSGRAKAGEGSILVHAERPGEALRYFGLAESYGLTPAAFAADRGLAYDLLGEQERAQRDYRLALRTPSTAAVDEETRRRYALSLAIAGKRELADQELQPLLRQSDRGAWRARAFVLALGGNVAEATRIATTMMPPGTAAGLQPFLERLPTLGPIDRAFAVHFGEVRSTPERLAAARHVPALPALGPDPYAPRVAVAAVVPDKGKKRSEPKRRGKREPVQVATVTPAPEPLPQTPVYRPAAGAPPVLATRGVAPTAWPTATATAPVAASPARSSVTLVSSGAASLPPRASPPATALAATATLPLASATPPRLAPSPAAVSAAVPRSAFPPPEANVTVGATAAVAKAPLVPLPVDHPVAAAPVAVRAEPVSSSRPPMTATIAPSVLDAPVEPRRASPALSRIVDGLTIPGAELGVGQPIVVPQPNGIDEHAADKAAAEKTAIERAAAERAAVDKIAADKIVATKALADKRAADRKAVAAKKALDEKKAAAVEKAEADREAAAQRKIERANPERIWVQVAGGANEHDLAKAWAAAKTKGGDIFAGHATGWTTPLRFTNRVLAGPFKTDDDARAFVNKAKGAGLFAFTFTSEAGQVVTRLSAK